MSTDVKITFRQRLRHPGRVVVVVVTLGMALGAGTTFFSALDALLDRFGLQQGLKTPSFR